MIGKKIIKPVSDWNEYTQTAIWCNSNKAIILDKVDYYEVVALPEKTAEELANEAMLKAKTERSDAVSRITVEVDGMTFDGDETSQNRMARKVLSAQMSGIQMSEKTDWVLADNTIASVSYEQLARACALAGQKQSELWVKPYEDAA